MLPEISYWMRYVMFDLAWISRSKVKVTILAYFFKILRHRYSTYRHQKKFLPYILPEISYWMRCHVWPWISRSKVYGQNIDIYLFEFRDIDSVFIDTKHKFLWYILPEISYWMRYVMFDLEFQGQGHNHDTYFFEFPDITLVIVDTKHKFIWHILPEISHWMRYVMFDLEFQGQRSRSRYWHIFFWISWHQFSGNRHKNYVSIASPSRDIE